MSLTCHKEIGRVGGGCYEDASDLSATSRGVGLVEFGERHDTRTNKQHYTAADRRPTNQVSEWQAERESRPTRPRHASHPRSILARMSCVCRQGCYEETAPVEFSFYGAHPFDQHTHTHTHLQCRTHRQSDTAIRHDVAIRPYVRPSVSSMLLAQERCIFGPQLVLSNTNRRPRVLRPSCVRALLRQRCSRRRYGHVDRLPISVPDYTRLLRRRRRFGDCRPPPR